MANNHWLSFFIIIPLYTTYRMETETIVYAYNGYCPCSKKLHEGYNALNSVLLKDDETSSYYDDGLIDKQFGNYENAKNIWGVKPYRYDRWGYPIGLVPDRSVQEHETWYVPSYHNGYVPGHVPSYHHEYVPARYARDSIHSRSANYLSHSDRRSDIGDNSDYPTNGDVIGDMILPKMPIDDRLIVYGLYS